MALEFTVLFSGLIAHIGVDETAKTHAVLVDDADHDPYIAIPAEPHKQIKKADRITFRVDGVVSAGSAPTSLNVFRKIVPHLSSLMDGTVIDEVMNRDDHDNVLSYVRFPDKSRLDVFEAYPLMATYKLQGVEKYSGCVSRVISLVIQANAVDLLLNGQVVGPLSSLIPTFISNASDGGFHFQRYAGLLKNVNNIAVVKETGPCTSFAMLGPADDQVPLIGRRQDAGASMVIATQVECSNSQWP
jgi:hypothetical protein